MLIRVQKSQPTAQELHVDQLLTNISLGYSNPMYIADQLCPLVTVMKQTDKIPAYDQSFWFRDSARLRAAGDKSVRGGFKVNTSATYSSDRYSIGFEIPDEVRDNTDQPFNMDRDGTMFVADKTQMKREVKFATDFFTTGVWGTDKTGGTDFTQWNDYADSSPLVDLSTYQDTVEAAIGRETNCLTIGKQVWLQLKWHPDLIDLIKYTQRGQLSTELFASLVDFPKVYVGRSIYTTTAEGTAEASVSYTRIWGKHALLTYVPDSPSLMNPAACYTFVWNRVAGAMQYIKRMRDEEREVDIIEANTYFDQKATVTKAGLFLSGAVA
jgi:hypothetical protein